jgi:hypothetical protein
LLGGVNKNPSPAVQRQFGVVMLIGLGALGAFIWARSSPDWRQWSGTGGQVAAAILGSVGLITLLVSIALPSVAKPLYVGWMTFASWIGAVMTPVILTILFIVFLPVFALIRFKDPLRLKLRRSGSYWEPHRPHEPTLERCYRPF